MNKLEFIERIGGLEACMAFEQQCLSIGREFLPECARAVLDGWKGNRQYWDWLNTQADLIEIEEQPIMKEKKS
jgi:hypothetical protein